MSKVVKVEDEGLVFDDGATVASHHSTSCCEYFWLCFKDLSLADFDGLEFDLTNNKFFEQVDDYGIRLLPLNGHPVAVPGYETGNGYYGNELELVVTTGSRVQRWDISGCSSCNDE